MYDVKDIQQIFRCGKNTAYELLNSPGFPSFKIGRKIYVFPEDLFQWVGKNKGRRNQR